MTILFPPAERLPDLLTGAVPAYEHNNLMRFFWDNTSFLAKNCETTDNTHNHVRNSQFLDMLGLPVVPCANTPLMPNHIIMPDRQCFSAENLYTIEKNPHMIDQFSRKVWRLMPAIFIGGVKNCAPQNLLVRADNGHGAVPEICDAAHSVLQQDKKRQSLHDACAVATLTFWNHYGQREKCDPARTRGHYEERARAFHEAAWSKTSTSIKTEKRAWKKFRIFDSEIPEVLHDRAALWQHWVKKDMLDCLMAQAPAPTPDPV